MNGVGLAICVGDDVVNVSRVSGEGSSEPPELFLVGVEGGPSGFDEDGDHGCCAILYRRGYRCREVLDIEGGVVPYAMTYSIL